MLKAASILVLLLCSSLLPASPPQYEAPPYGTIGPDWQFLRTNFKAKDLPPADYRAWRSTDLRDNRDPTTWDICAPFGDLAVQAHLDALTGGAGDAEHYTSILWLYATVGVTDQWTEFNRLRMTDYFYKSIRLAPTQYLLPKMFDGLALSNFGEARWREVMGKYQEILDSSIVAGVDHNDFELAMCVETHEEGMACFRRAMRKWPYDKTVAHHYDYLIAQFLLSDFWEGFWEKKNPDKLLGMLKYMMQRKLLKGNSMAHFSQPAQHPDTGPFAFWGGRVVRIPFYDPEFVSGINMTADMEAMMKTELYEFAFLFGKVLGLNTNAPPGRVRSLLASLKSSDYWNTLEEVRPGPEWW